MPIYPTNYDDTTLNATNYTDTTINATNWENDDPSAGYILLESSSILLNEQAGYMELQ